MKNIAHAGSSRSRKFFYLIVLGGVFCTAVYALDYLGANGVLQEIATRLAGPVESQQKSESSQLRDDLKSFSGSATNLSPADASAQWLALFERFIKLQQQSRMNYTSNDRPPEPDDLLAALPPPSDWNELAKAIAARPPAKSGEEMAEAGLRFLSATLTGDSEGQKREITALQKKAGDAPVQQVYFYNNILQEWSRATLAVSSDPDAVLKSMDNQLSSLGKERAKQLLVPNLVSQVGAEKAEAFLRKALLTPNVLLQFKQSDETSRLAQKLAMELMAQLKSPQWGLVNSLDATALYEAMARQFGAETNKPEAMTETTDAINMSVSGADEDYMTAGFKQQAQVYYMLGLISQNRAKDAVAIAKKIGGQSERYQLDEAFQQMEHSGYTMALDDFLYELLSQNPALSFWDEYVQTAAATGNTERMLVLVRSAATRNDLSDVKKAAIRQILFKALLAADSVDAGVEEMRHLVALNDSGESTGEYNAGELSVMLARIGLLENKMNWVEEGIGDAKKWLATPAAQNFSGSAEAVSVLDSLTEILFQIQRGPEAEKVLTDALADAARGNNPQEEEGWGNPSQQILGQLALLYHKAGHYDDVLNLLQQSSDWGVKDLSDLFETSPWENGVSMMWLHTGSSPMPVPYLAANAMIVTGQKEKARKIVEELLIHNPGLDRGYELLLALDGTNAIPQLDELFKRDQFEERPLIWKAHLLRQENNLDEAEKTIRQAIAIDPSDGEEGRGDRMRAYAELADILDARGDKKNADFFREIVKAIRMSEDADQFYQAGLLKHAIAMYEEALNHFSDAYCIQSRLAIQLSAMGQNEAAEEHYRRAYELMPDSFGRVESHCFGCERAFDGQRAQSIAEQVFTKVVAERPKKPQAYYLLGYLRTEQERFNEARLNFLSAVRLDPDYLNAWVKLQEASEQTLVPAKGRDEIAFNILRLDPLQRHASANFESVTDLPRLWDAIATAAAQQPELSTNLWTLVASKAALEKKVNNSQNRMTTAMENQIYYGRTPLSPGRAIAQTSFVQLAGQLMGGNSYLGD